MGVDEWRAVSRAMLKCAAVAERLKKPRNAEAYRRRAVGYLRRAAIVQRDGS